MSSQKSVLVVGDALMDNLYYVDAIAKAGQDVKINEFSKSTGGSAANTAIALGKCDVQTMFCGSVGDDDDGAVFIKKLKQHGIDTSLVRQSGKTGFTVTMIDSEGERTMFSYRGASASDMRVSKELRERLGEVELVLLSGYFLLSQSEFLQEIAKIAKESGTTVALDPSPIVGRVDCDVLRKMLALTDVLLPNEVELDTIIKKVGDIAVPCVAVKLGGEGAKLVQDGNEYFEPASKVDAIDTTGAGDAFNAGFLASMLSNDEPQMWLKKGNELAATVVSKKGAV